MIEILAALAVARVSVFIVRERAPFGIMEKVRQWLKVDTLSIYDGIMENPNQQTNHPEGMTGVIKELKPPVYELAYLLSCVWCISLWIGLIACLLLDFPLWYALPFSAVAIIYDEKIS